MIIVKLKGGLGNQMFQYAAARRLAMRHNVELKMDCSEFVVDTKRSYQLCNFMIAAKFASSEEISWINRQRRKKTISKVFSRLMNFFRQDYKLMIVEEANYNFDAKILELPDQCYLDGYWQSEAYFKDISSVIRQEFQFQNPLTGQDEVTAREIAQTQSVSVHVRRGDYASEPAVNAFHGLCSLDYYRHCMAEVGQHVVSPHFFVFSDEPDWACQNIVSPYPITYVVRKNAQQDGVKDLQLMSLCTHNIIANSSFSWWGAWLNKHPGKRVYAPKRWFANNDVELSTRIPMDWIAV